MDSSAIFEKDISQCTGSVGRVPPEKPVLPNIVHHQGDRVNTTMTECHNDERWVDRLEHICRGLMDEGKGNRRSGYTDVQTYPTRQETKDALLSTTSPNREERV